MTSRDEAERHPFYDEDNDEDGVIYLSPSSPASIPQHFVGSSTCDKSWLELRTDGSAGPNIELWAVLWEWARFRLEHGDDDWDHWRVANRVQLLTVWIDYEPHFDASEALIVEGLDGRYVATVRRGSRRLVAPTKPLFLAEARDVLDGVQAEVERLNALRRD